MFKGTSAVAVQCNVERVRGWRVRWNPRLQYRITVDRVDVRAMQRKLQQELGGRERREQVRVRDSYWYEIDEQLSVPPRLRLRFVLRT